MPTVTDNVMYMISHVITSDVEWQPEKLESVLKMSNWLSQIFNCNMHFY